MDGLDDNSNIVSRLDSWSNEIKQFVNLILEITTQTNLLAVNASIESAKAGESGKSFRVIANEMKKLSLKTKDSINSIENILNESSNYSRLLIETTSALQEEKTLLNNLLRNMSDMIFFKDLNSNYVRVSNSLVDFFSKDVDDVIGRSDHIFFSPGEAEDIQKKEERIIAERKGISNEIMELNTEKGLRYLSTTKTPNISENDEVIGLIGITRDITRIKELEIKNTLQDAVIETTKTQNKLFNEIIDNLEDKIELKDPEGKFYLINKASAKEYRLGIEELIGKSVFDFYDQETAQEYFESEKELVLKRTPQYSLEKVFLFGEEKYLFLNKTPIFIPKFDDYGLLVIKRDISSFQIKSKKYMQELKKEYPTLEIFI